jgi:hypothetical protein
MWAWQGNFRNEVAIEIKGTDRVQDQHLKGLRAFKDEYKTTRCIAVSRDARPRKTSDGIEVLPWAVFLESLWTGKIMK